MNEKIKLVSPDGWTFEGLTFEQACQLHERFAGTSKSPPRSTSKSRKAARSSPTATAPQGTFQRFAEVIVEPKFKVEHHLVAIVAGHGDKGITIPKLMQGLSITTNGGIGARFAGVGRACKQAGLDKEQVIIKEGNTYRAGQLLAKHIGDLPPVPEP